MDGGRIARLAALGASLVAIAVGISVGSSLPSVNTTQGFGLSSDPDGTPRLHFLYCRDDRIHHLVVHGYEGGGLGVASPIYWAAESEDGSQVREVRVGEPPPGFVETVPLTLAFPTDDHLSVEGVFSIDGMSVYLPDLTSATVIRGDYERVSLAEFQASETAYCSARSNQGLASLIALLGVLGLAALGLDRLLAGRPSRAPALAPPMALLSTIVAGCLLALLGAFSGDATLSRVAESLLASLFFLFPSLVIASLLLVPIVYLVIALIPARARRLAMCMLFPVPFVGWAAYVYQGIPDLTGLLPAVAALIAGAFVPLPRVEYETHLPARTRMFQTTLAFGALLLGAVLAIQLLSAPYVLPSAAQYAGELADFQRPVDSAEPPPIPAGATVLAEFSGHGDGEELLVYLGFPAGSEYSVLASCSGTSLQFAQVSSDADSSFASRVVVPCSEPPSIQREVPLPSSGRAELRVFPAADQDWFLTVVAP